MELKVTLDSKTDLSHVLFFFPWRFFLPKIKIDNTFITDTIKLEVMGFTFRAGTKMILTRSNAQMSHKRH